MIHASAAAVVHFSHGRQTETGKLTLEGVLSETYYQVRSLLYQQYAIL